MGRSGLVLIRGQVLAQAGQASHALAVCLKLGVPRVGLLLQVLGQVVGVLDLLEQDEVRNAGAVSRQELTVVVEQVAERGQALHELRCHAGPVVTLAEAHLDGVNEVLIANLVQLNGSGSLLGRAAEEFWLVLLCDVELYSNGL